MNDTKDITEVPATVFIRAFMDFEDYDKPTTSKEEKI